MVLCANLVFRNSLLPVYQISRHINNSTNNSESKPAPAKQPKIYTVSDDENSSLIKENKDKCGVYRFKNLLNGKAYIGSSTNLGVRLTNHFSINYISKRHTVLIYKAFLKYGYQNFSLEILEYCDPEKAIEREQYYMDLLQPEYNILKTAGSSFGLKHSLETKAKLSASLKR